MTNSKLRFPDDKIELEKLEALWEFQLKEAAQARGSTKVVLQMKQVWLSSGYNFKYLETLL